MRHLKTAADAIFLTLCLLIAAASISIAVIPAPPNRYEARESVYRNAEQNSSKYVACPGCGHLMERARSCKNCGNY